MKKNLFDYLEKFVEKVYNESIHFRKWSQTEKRAKKKKLNKGKRGSNFKQLKPKKGFKRILIPGTKRFIRIRMTPTEKRVKKKIGKRLGTHPNF